MKILVVEDNSDMLDLLALRVQNNRLPSCSGEWRQSRRWKV